MNGKGLLKFSSFFMLLWGILNLIAGLSFVLGFPFAKGITGPIKEDSMILAIAVFTVIGSCELLSSIFGFRAVKHPSKAVICIVFSIITILSNLAILFLGDTNQVDWLSLWLSELIPIIYFFGSILCLIKTKKR